MFYSYPLSIIFYCWPCLFFTLKPLEGWIKSLPAINITLSCHVYFLLFRHCKADHDGVLLWHLPEVEKGDARKPPQVITEFIEITHNLSNLYVHIPGVSHVRRNATATPLTGSGPTVVQQQAQAGARPSSLQSSSHVCMSPWSPGRSNACVDTSTLTNKSMAVLIWRKNYSTLRHSPFAFVHPSLCHHHLRCLVAFDHFELFSTDACHWRNVTGMSPVEVGQSTRWAPKPQA